MDPRFRGDDGIFPIFNREWYITGTLPHMNIDTFILFHPYYYFAIIGLFGLAIGSFLNVVIVRLPQMLQQSWKAQSIEYLLEDHPKVIASSFVPSEKTSEPTFNLFLPRSHCPSCKTPLKIWHNIPLLSFLLLKGQCAHCKKKISWRYPTIEFITALLSVIVAMHFGFSWQTLFALILTWVLILLSMIDFDHKILPDDIMIPMIWLGLFTSLFGIFLSPKDAILGAVMGYGSLYLLYQAFKLITGKEGMGFGDFKLLSLLGAWLGWQSLPMILIFSSFLGATYGLILIFFTGHNRDVPIPFGPYLAGAGWLSLIWGNTLTQWYLTLFGML